jgi:AmmeMemoRadiSam system protein B
MTIVRQSAVAGTFYPGNAKQLDAALRGYLGEAGSWQGPVPKAIIAPHAGYIYSGPVAATAYARLAPARGRIARVVLLGPCHRIPVRGLAASGADAFVTPLGQIPVDREAIQSVLDLPQVGIFDPTHALEHSLEVHLPFLQEVLGDFKLVPFVVGLARPEEVAEVLDRLWGGPETLIVVSTDLSHYLDYDAARTMDAATREAIENFDGAAIPEEGACGRHPVRGLLLAAKRRGLAIETVDVRNSGDTAGPKDRVVGYGSWVLTEPGDD